MINVPIANDLVDKTLDDIIAHSFAMGDLLLKDDMIDLLWLWQFQKTPYKFTGKIAKVTIELKT